MVREDVLQRATDRNWTRAASEDSASSMSRSTSWAIRAPWCCFSMRGSCFCLLCSFLSCVCALILMHSMNSFFTLFPSLFLLLLPGGDFFPSYFGFIYYPWFLCYVRFMSFFCQALGACNFFVWKHMELHFLYERCYRKQFIIGLFTRKCHCAFNMRHNNLDVSIPMS